MMELIHNDHVEVGRVQMLQVGSADGLNRRKDVVEDCRSFAANPHLAE